MNASPTDIDALLRESRAVREDATRLLRELRLVEQRQEYGAVEVRGSYRWDLMLDADLDLDVINPAVDLDLVLAAFERFVRSGDFLWFGFGDSVRAKPAWSVPEGYYLGMSSEFNGRHWKVDTWFLPSPQPSHDWLMERLTEESRRTILALKAVKRAGRLSIASYDIYRAVLLGGTRTAEEVQAWLAREADAAG